MTLPEMLLALDEDLEKKRPPAGSQPLQSAADKAEYARQWRQMSREERLQQAREG